jgi:hypothetical protein
LQIVELPPQHHAVALEAVQLAILASYLAALMRLLDSGDGALHSDAPSVSAPASATRTISTARRSVRGNDASAEVESDGRRSSWTCKSAMDPWPFPPLNIRINI